MPTRLGLWVTLSVGLRPADVARSTRSGARRPDSDLSVHPAEVPELLLVSGGVSDETPLALVDGPTCRGAASTDSVGEDCYLDATAFTVMCFGLASSPFGSFTVRTPFSNDASVFVGSISTGRLNER